jgi:hypothetical protein
MKNGFEQTNSIYMYGQTAQLLICTIDQYINYLITQLPRSSVKLNFKSTTDSNFMLKMVILMKQVFQPLIQDSNIWAPYFFGGLLLTDLTLNRLRRIASILLLSEAAFLATRSYRIHTYSMLARAVWITFVWLVKEKGDFVLARIFICLVLFIQSTITRSSTLYNEIFDKRYSNRQWKFTNLEFYEHGEG